MLICEWKRQNSSSEAPDSFVRLYLNFFSPTENRTEYRAMSALKLQDIISCNWKLYSVRSSNKQRGCESSGWRPFYGYLVHSVRSVFTQTVLPVIRILNDLPKVTLRTYSTPKLKSVMRRLVIFRNTAFLHTLLWSLHRTTCFTNRD